MKEYIYEETKYIKRKDLNEYADLMLQYDFIPEEIEDNKEFNIVFQYLVNLTEKAPDFLQPYEYALSMLSLIEPDEGLRQLQKDLEAKWVAACQKIARRRVYSINRFPGDFWKTDHSFGDYFLKPTGFGIQENWNRPTSCSARFLKRMKVITLAQGIQSRQLVRE